VIAGTTLPQVDDIVYTIPVGTVCPELMPTHYGLHVVKLLGRQKARQRVRASQILYRLDVNNPLDTAAGYARMSLILDSLKRGLATFEELARRNSMDPESGAKGGDMGWVDRGMHLEEHFEEALFNVPLGEVSPVVRSAFGMHIIKVTEEAPPPPYEEQKNALREIYMRERFAADYERLMRGLRSAYRYRFNEKVAQRLTSRMDSGWTTSTPGWDLRLSAEDKEAFLFSLGDEGVPVRVVVGEIKREPDLQMRPFTIPALDSIAASIADRTILVRESAGLEERLPEFRKLMDEFRESSWVARLEQDAVWDSVRISDEEARRYWNAHRSEFRWPDRVGFSEIYVYSDVDARKLLDSLKAGVSFADLASRHTRRTGMFQKGGSWGLQPVDRNELSRAAARLEIGQVSDIIPQDPGVSIVRTDAKEAAREKTFEEARSEVLARAKEEAAARRLRELTDELRKRYKVRTFPQHLDAAFAGTR
ncbi:MAG: peptidylprolyl isomerase, partial [Bacteroidota bacterium]|nr:peptidylprolyl isomerase [Bacteroidota bacterium]